MEVVVEEVLVRRAHRENHSVLAQTPYEYQKFLIPKRLTVDTGSKAVPTHNVFIFLLMVKSKKHTTGGIPRWSPTLVLVARFSAYVWQSGRDAQFSLTYGRMCLLPLILYTYCLY